MTDKLKPGAKDALIVVDVQNDFVQEAGSPCRRGTRSCRW